MLRAAQVVAVIPADWYNKAKELLYLEKYLQSANHIGKRQRFGSSVIGGASIMYQAPKYNQATLTVKEVQQILRIGQARGRHRCHGEHSSSGETA